MISANPNILDFSDAGKIVRILYTSYSGRQKQQKLNYIKMAAGTIGVIKVRILDPSFNNEYYLVQILTGNQTYYCKLARTMIEFIQQSSD